MKRLDSERIKTFLEQMNMQEEDAVIQSKMFTRQAESVQKRMKGSNYDTRRNVLQYDGVMREQREVIYAQWQEVIMEENGLSNVLMDMVKRTTGQVVDNHTRLEKEEQNLDGIADFTASTLVHEDMVSKKNLGNKLAKEIEDYLVARVQEVFEERFQQLNGQEQLLEFEKVIILRVAGTKQIGHIGVMDQLRQSVGLRAYGQNNPLVEYQTEGYSMYNNMVGPVEYEVTRLFMESEIRQDVQREQVAQGQTGHPETEQDAAA